MAERQSKLFPNKKARPRTNGMKDMEEFTKSLSISSADNSAPKVNTTEKHSDDNKNLKIQIKVIKVKLAEKLNTKIQD
ncbi:hypothetical protein N8D25_15205 (plasmid) [Enterococcus faecium]